MEWDQDKIEELAQVINKYDLTEIEIKNGETRITIKKTPATVQMVQGPHGVPMKGFQSRLNTDFRRITEKKALQDELETQKTVEKDENQVTISDHTEIRDRQKFVTSPMTGIFYRQAQPGNPPYAEIGQRVKKGDIVCLVEAMKMINEIAANRDGVIKKFFVEDEEFVEYGAPLVMIEEE